MCARAPVCVHLVFSSDRRATWQFSSDRRATWQSSSDRRATWQTLRKEQGNELYAAGDIDGAIQKYKESVEEYLPSECQIVSEEGESSDQKEVQKREARSTAIAARLNLGMCYTRRAHQPMYLPRDDHMITIR